MKGIRFAILALGIVVALCSQVFASLDEQAWKEASRELADALQSGDFRAISSAIERIGEDDSSRAVRLILAALERRAEDVDLFDSAKDAIARMKASGARKEMRKQVKSAKDWRGRLCLLEVLASSEDQQDLTVIAGALKDRRDEVAVAAARIFGRRQLVWAVETLIERAVELDRKKGRVWIELKEALYRITGVHLQAGEDYRGWWSVNREGFQPPKVFERKPRDEKGETTTLFGQPIECSRIVFVIDVSGSMEQADDVVLFGGRTRARGERPRDEPTPEERKRIVRAKNELIRVIEDLPASTQFNIIAYSSNVTFWKEKGLHKNSPGNRKSAKEFVNGFKAEGVTVTDLALELAFQQIPEAHCIYLISDGFATHDGTTRIPPQEILSEVARLNRFRQVRIHTLGFKDADRDLMQRLAMEHAGDYTDIK